MEDFVPHEVAVKLKQKGFDYPCLFVYNKEQIINPEVVKAFGELSDDGYYELTKEGGGRLDWNFVYIYKHQLIPYRDVLIEREIIKAPTISKVLKWLREEKKLHILVLFITDCSKDAELSICEEWSFWSFSITNLNDGSTMYDDFEKSDCIEFQSYELAALAGIEYVLDNLI